MHSYKCKIRRKTEASNEKCSRRLTLHLLKLTVSFHEDHLPAKSRHVFDPPGCVPLWFWSFYKTRLKTIQYSHILFISANFTPTYTRVTFCTCFQILQCSTPTNSKAKKKPHTHIHTQTHCTFVMTEQCVRSCRKTKTGHY